MKKHLFIIVLFLFTLGLVGCQESNSTTQETTQETTTTTTTTEANDSEVTIIIDNSTYVLSFHGETEDSLFNLILSSDIHLNYSMTDWGPYIHGIGHVSEDPFHWISFMKNGDFAMEGLSTISFEDGDTFSFTAELSTWSLTLTSTFIETSEIYYIFETLDGISYKILIDSIDVSIYDEDFIVGEEYTVTGSLDMDLIEEGYYIIPVEID